VRNAALSAVEWMLSPPFARVESESLTQAGQPAFAREKSWKLSRTE
jgi:hypothetical protein